MRRWGELGAGTGNCTIKAFFCDEKRTLCTHKNQPKKAPAEKDCTSGEMGFLSSTDNVCHRIPVTLSCIVY